MKRQSSQLQAVSIKAFIGKVRQCPDDELFQMEDGDHASFSHWIDGFSIHQSDQLEEAGRCEQMDREGGVATCRFPKYTREGLPWFGRRLEISFNKDCSIIPPSLASVESFCQHINTFDVDSPETTVANNVTNVIH